MEIFSMNKNKSNIMETFKNQGSICGELYYSQSKTPVIFSILKKSPPPEGAYVFVIRESEPKTIYFHTADLFVVMHTYNIKTGKTETLHHSCLAKNKNVICAGEMFLTQRTAILINASGHYIPKYRCLQYTSELLSKLGYNSFEYQNM
jgi:hypothetical protein